MHLADRLDLPKGYTARPYRGAVDHALMAPVLTAYRESQGDPESVLPEHLDQSYRKLNDCDAELDIALVEHDGEVVGYGRPTFARVPSGLDLVVFPPLRPDHQTQPLFDAFAAGQEAHLRKWIRDGAPARYRAYAGHPGPGETPTGEAAWLEARGYEPTEWGASLRRPHLDDIPDLPLPDGVEVRPVAPDQIRHILEVHHEAFRGDWDFRELTEDGIDEMLADPHLDETLWQVAWDGDTVVGQVKPFINEAENEARGYRRGYTEYISTHADYRNRGIAKALLARALRAIRDRGMTEAVLGVDTNNPGGAFQLYQGLGFVLESYAAVYTKPAAG